MKRVEVKSDVTGTAWKIEAPVGTMVEEGDTVVMVESMKMEIPVSAPVSGRVVELLVAEGGAVADEQLVAVIEVQ